MVGQSNNISWGEQSPFYQDKSLDAAGMMHDLNNMLMVILTSISLALTKLPPDSPVRNHLEVALQAEQQAAVLAHQISNDIKKHHYITN